MGPPAPSSLSGPEPRATLLEPQWRRRTLSLAPPGFPGRIAMPIRTIVLAAGVVALAAISSWATAPALAQSAATLSGEVSLAQEGSMEGVVVSAKKDGS